MNEKVGATLSKWGLVPLRVVVGMIFLMHGSQKVFVFGIAGTADILRWVGIPFPTFFAVVVMATELLGGLAILTGFFARWASVCLAIDMTVAIVAARMQGGFFTPNGFEFELVLLGACLTIAAIGTGAGSLDKWVTRQR
ncbi:MAG: DoxX family protein [Gemmatimonadales bacterium]